MDKQQPAVTKRFQPYARITPRRQPGQPIAQQEEDSSKSIPKIILNFVKESLSWLGITQKENPELQEELNSTKGDFELQPGADKDGESSTVGSGSSNNLTAPQSSTTKERRYPDLREYITTLKEDNINRSCNRTQLEADLENEMMTPERQARRKKLRMGLALMEPTDYYHTNTVEMSNPLMESKDEDIDMNDSNKGHDVPEKMPEKASSLNLTQSGPDAEEIEGLTREELILLGRIRRLTETPLERARRNAKASAENRLKEEKIPREFITPYSLIRLAREEPEPAPRQNLKPLDTALSYHKRTRPNSSIRDDVNDYVMGSGDSEFDADESDHAKFRTLQRARQARRREKPHDITQSSSSRTRRTSRPEVHEDQRTPRGGLQSRSNVTPKRHVKSIPGRFSALDTDEEEEDLQKEIARRAQRAAQHATQRAIDAAANRVGSSLLRSSHVETPKNGPSGSRPQPQLYPSLRFGAKNLYNQKLDEVLAWTSSPHEPFNKSTSGKESVTSSIISEVISAAPAVIGTIAAAAGATEIAKLASDWADEKDAKDTKDAKDAKDAKGANNVKDVNDTQKAPSVPGLFAPPSFGFSSAPASFALTSVDKNPEVEKKVEVEKEKEANKPKEKEAEVEKKPTPPTFGGWAATSIKMPDNSDKWRCPTCDVRNNNDLNKCPCCETPKPGAKPAEQKPLAAPSLFTPSFGLTSSTPKPTTTTTATTTSVPPLFSFGTTTTSATTTTPNASSPAPSTSIQAKDTHAAPGAPKLEAFGGWGATSIKMPDSSNKWKCPTCDVRNSNDLNKCPCCETAKPGGSTSASSAAPTVPDLFAFKPPTSTVASAPTSLTGAATAPVFKPFTPPPNPFGALSSTASATPPTISTTLSSETKPPMSSFAAPISTATPTTASHETPKPALSGSFANPFASKPPASSAPTLFGSMTAPATSSAPSTSESTAKPAQPVFTFGTPSTSAAPTSTPLFGNTSAAITPTVSLFGATQASSTTPSSTPLFGSTVTATPTFGSSTTGTSGLLGAGSTTTTPASTTAPSAPLFSLPTPATSTTSSTPTTATAPPPLFGAPASTPSLLTTSSTVPPSSSQFSFGASGASLTTFSKPTTAASSTPALTTNTTTATSAPTFTFGSSSNPTTTTASTSGVTTTGSGVSGFSGFGAPVSSTSTPFSLAAPTTTSSTGFTFGNGTATTTSQPAKTPSFAFGSSAPATGTGFGASTATPTFAFGSNTATNNASSAGGSTGFAGFGANQSTNNSMMSPTMSNATPTTSNGSTGFGGFGSTSQSSGTGFNTGFNTSSAAFGSATPAANAFGSSTVTSTPTFGTSTPTPSGGFGASVVGTPQANSFGQPAGGFGSSMGGGFGASNPSFSAGNSNASPFGGSSANSGFISLARPSGAAPAFGASGAFGGGAGAPQSGQTFGGFGANNDGKFGFQNISNAPGGAQYGQSPLVLQQPPGGFQFNMGAAPAPGEKPANRKIAKMRSKKR